MREFVELNEEKEFITHYEGGIEDVIKLISNYGFDLNNTDLERKIVGIQVCTFRGVALNAVRVEV